MVETRLEKESFKTLDKPESFAHAQEIEKEAVLFAKEVLLYFFLLLYFYLLMRFFYISIIDY